MSGIPIRHGTDLVNRAFSDNPADHPTPGEICFDDRGVWIVCPGCRTVTHIPFVRSTPSHDIWQWNGDRDKPSLTPSLNHPGCWHGYLTNGEFVSC